MWLDGVCPFKKFCDEIIKQSRRNKNCETSRNSLVKISDKFSFPGICDTSIVLLVTFSRTRFSRRSTQRIFLVVVPLLQCIAPWLSFLIMIGNVSRRLRSRNNILYSRTSFVVSLMLWTSAWQDDCAASLCRAQPQAIGAPACITNHPDSERRICCGYSVWGASGFGTDASIGPQLTSE